MVGIEVKCKNGSKISTTLIVIISFCKLPHRFVIFAITSFIASVLEIALLDVAPITSLLRLKLIVDFAARDEDEEEDGDCEWIAALFLPGKALLLAILHALGMNRLRYDKRLQERLSSGS